MQCELVGEGIQGEHPVVTPVLVEQTEAVTMQHKNHGHSQGQYYLASIYDTLYFSLQKEIVS